MHKKIPCFLLKAGENVFNQTPYLFVATGTPGPIVEVTVQDFR